MECSTVPQFIPVPNSNSGVGYLNLVPNFLGPRCMQAGPVQFQRVVWGRLYMRAPHSEYTEDQ
jgi:hypothetical protein